MAKYSLIILFSLFIGKLFAQDQWLVTAKLDTVRGKIYLDYRGPYHPDDAVVKNEKEKSIFKAYEVRLVWLGNNDTYEGIKIDQRYQFAKVDVRGKYYTQYLYADPGTGNTASYSLKLLVDVNGEQHKLGNLIPKKKFAQYFEACEDVENRILSGELKRKNLTEIFEAYDACMDGREKELPARPAIPAKPAKPAEVTAMDEFIEAVKAKGLYEGDLSSMLDDVNQKITNGQTIPEYLKRAVLDQLKSDEALHARFNSIIDKNATE